MAREAIWERYLQTIPHETLDMAAIVEHCDLFTPADIEFAARKTAQLVFERAVAGSTEERATTGDILHAIARTRPTLTAELIEAFEQDIADHERA